MAVENFYIQSRALANIGSTADFLRVILDNGSIKYLKYQGKGPGSQAGRVSLRSDKPCFDFTELPRGDWNVANLNWNNSTSEFALGSQSKEELATIEPWHNSRMDWRRLPEKFHCDSIDQHPQVLGLMTSHVREPCFGNANLVVCNFNWHPEAIAEQESLSSFYEVTEGHNITPKFLGHITDDHGKRIIGYVTEFIPYARLPTASDLPACQVVLQRLHDLGWSMGDPTSPNLYFFIDDATDTAYIQGAVFASPAEDTEEFEMEMDELKFQLEAIPAHRGGN